MKKATLKLIAALGAIAFIISLVFFLTKESSASYYLLDHLDRMKPELITPYQIVMGRERTFLLNGWGEEELWLGKKPFLWALSGEAHLSAHLFPVSNGELILSARPFEHPKGEKLKANILLNGKGLSEIELKEEWERYRIPLPRNILKNRENRIDLFFSYAISPHDLDRKNDDTRRLSAAFDLISLPAYLTSAKIGKETRTALTAPSPYRVSFPIKVPSKGKLSFGIGILNREGKRRIVRFSVALRRGNREKTLFDRVVDTSSPEGGGWQDFTLDLSPYQGKEGELVFSATPLIKPLSLPDKKGAKENIIACFSDPVIYQEKKSRLPNIILISIDTLRADHLSCYGYPRETSKNIDKLAKEGVIFTEAIAPSPWTLPSHISILTSLYPSFHGVTKVDTALDPNVPILTEHLRRRGFACYAFVSHDFVSEKYGFARGFNRFFFSQEARAREVTDFAIKTIEGNNRFPFFLFLHYFDPHLDYTPPPPYDKLFDRDYKGKIDGTRDSIEKARRKGLSKADLNHITALYDGEIAYTDSQLGRLFAKLEETRLIDDTLVIITSDHGEEFLEHGSFGHGETLYEEMLRVPLIIHFPKGKYVGRRVDVEVSTIDIAPTILAFLNLSPLPGEQGENLLPYLKGKIPPSRFLMSGANKFGPKKHSIRGENHKYILTIYPPSGAKEEFYNLSSDPKEKKNIIGSKPPLFARMKKELLSFIKRAHRVVGRRMKRRIHLDEETKNRLRALGYIK